MADGLPTFALSHVLFPGAVVVVRVFEERYKALMQAVIQEGNRLGVVLIERGSEVGGGDTRFNVGCTARIRRAVKFPDGGWRLNLRGAERIRVRRWMPDDPYPRAEVEEWLDPGAFPGAADRRDQVLAALRRTLALAVEMGDVDGGQTAALGEIVDDPVLASYQMSALTPVGPLDHLALLSAPTLADRFRLHEQLLEDEHAMLARRLEEG